MKIEYLHDGSPDCPLIRLYGKESKDFSCLLDLFRKLSCGALQEVEIHNLPGFETVRGCRLVAKVGRRDEGVQRRGLGQDFEWILTPASWEVVADLVQPFTEPKDFCRHQWLAGKEAQFGLNSSEIAVLISSSDIGEW